MLLASYGGKSISTRSIYDFLPPCLVPSLDHFHNYIIQLDIMCRRKVALPAESPNMSFSAWFVSLLVVTSFYE